VTAQVRDNVLELGAPSRGQCPPVLTGTREAVQQQKRLAVPMDFEVELYAVERFDSPRRLYGRHGVSSKKKTPTLSRGR
jgi:hypothetical protein